MITIKMDVEAMRKRQEEKKRPDWLEIWLEPWVGEGSEGDPSKRGPGDAPPDEVDLMEIDYRAPEYRR